MSLWLSLIVVSLPTTDARALDSQDDEARALFEAGLVAYQSQRFESALLYFSRSLALSRRAKLHYNIGLTLERLDRAREAIAAYDEYLSQLPDADNRDEVEARLAVLKSSVLPTEQAPQPARAEPVQAPLEALASAHGATTDPTPRRLGWGLVIGGGVLSAGGGVLLGLAAHALNKVEDAPQGSSWRALEDDEARVKPLSITGFAALGVGVASVAAGSVLLLRHRSARVDVAALPYGLRIQGSF